MVGASLAILAAVVLVVQAPDRHRDRAAGAPAGTGHRGQLRGAAGGAPVGVAGSHPARAEDGLRAEPWLRPVGTGARGYLRAGSQPSALGSSVLIADKLNNRLVVVDDRGRVRWQFPAPSSSTRGQTLPEPDDAFFSPDGRYIVATQEDRAVISVIDVATDRIVFRYGIAGHPGMSADHVSNPDDAIPIGQRTILTADIKNCRLLLLSVGSHTPQRIIGHSTTACRHRPPTRWGSPNGAFPIGGGRYLVTEINGDWVDCIDLTGKVYWSTHPPAVTYPSDSNRIGPDSYLSVDYSQPGQIVIFNRAGHTLWRYRGHGADTLNHPSLALPLPNGNLVLNDDFNHRVIVVDPRTRRIVWQYGHTGTPGRTPGYLDNPDGLDLVPPHSLTMTRLGAA